MSLVRKIALLSAISILPALSMDNPAPKPTLNQIKNMSAQQLADADLNLRLIQNDWETLFPGKVSSGEALDAKTKIRQAMRLRSEKVRINPEDALRSIESARIHEEYARTNIGQGLDLGIEAEDLTQNLSASIQSILGKMAQLENLSKQSGEAVMQIQKQIETLARLVQQSGQIDQEKQRLVDDLRQKIQILREDQGRVDQELPSLEELLQKLSQ